MVNEEPWLGVLATEMVPPSRRQNCRVMARPSPVPSYFRVVPESAWRKGWKIFSSWSSEMPMPLSLTVKRSYGRGSPASVGRSICSTMRVISPSWVNLVLLLRRFKSACCSFPWSVFRMMGALSLSVLAAVLRVNLLLFLARRG